MSLIYTQFQPPVSGVKNQSGSRPMSAASIRSSDLDTGKFKALRHLVYLLVLSYL